MFKLNPANEHYCYNCHELIGKDEIADHRKRGHDVDTNSQSYYEEIERIAAGGRS